MKYLDACEKLKNSFEWLDYYYSKFGSFYIQSQKPQNYTKWHKFNNKNDFDFDPTERQVFGIEIPIDIDGKDKKESEILLNLIDSALHMDFSYSIWDTTSKGFHIHIFIPELDNIKGFDKKIMKKIILEYFSEMSGVKQIDKMMCNEKKLINLECAVHRKTGERKFLVKINKTFIKNKIPKVCWERYYNEKKEIDSKRFQIKKIVYDNKNKKCINFFNSLCFAKIGDLRKRALFVLVTDLKKRGKSDSEIFHIIKMWRDTILVGYNDISDYQIESTIKSNNGSCSCRYIKLLLRELSKESICENCPLNTVE